jgi:hypothetical protein
MPEIQSKSRLSFQRDIILEVPKQYLKSEVSEESTSHNFPGISRMMQDEMT